MLGFIKRTRRQRVLARQALPARRWETMLADIPSMAGLDEHARRRLRDLALLFLHEKSLEPAGGHSLDESQCLRIAALACRPVLELERGIDLYAGFKSVIVYPGEFLVRHRAHEDEVGVVHESDDVLSGEAWENGPVVLAWQDVLASGQGRAFDVVAHEFAHKLDLTDGAINGLPALHRGMSVEAWIETFQAAFDDLTERLERDEETWLDPYAAEDPGEFFAVCSEMFFDVPDELGAAYPQIYAQLAAYYRQDPAENDSAEAAKES
jgi:Mlc titration factor MtfA (ptsG expression regulator)